MARNPGKEDGECPMNINEQIKTALAPTGWLVVSDVKQADTKQYFVFNYESLGDNFGNNAPGNERYIIQIHLFCPPKLDTVDLRNKVKKLLFENDFTFPSVISASDEDGQHWVFECEAVVEAYG